MKRIGSRVFEEHHEDRLLFPEGTTAELMQVLVQVQRFTRLNLWRGNPATGQSFGHSEASFGFYLKRADICGGGGWQEMRIARRADAERDLPMPSDVIMVTTANGSRVLYKHPSYRPVYDWSRARMHEQPGDESGVCIYAPLYQELDEKLAHGLLPTIHAAAHFLRVAKMTDIPSDHELCPSLVRQSSARLSST